MNTSLIIKMGTIENLDEIAILFNEYRIFYGQKSDLEGARTFLFDRFEHRESIIFIAIESQFNKLIGFTQLYPSFSSVSMKRSWILNDLYVLEEYRKQGVAKQLMAAAETFAKQTKAKGLGLSTAISNVRAQRLYDNSGYKRDNEFYHYYRSV
jgi:ribosomal protein S18 acetylase RimI-like enzyme